MRNIMDNNPLRQYFRRPSVYLKLPSGGHSYTPDVVDMPETGELPVYPMTAVDEITARTPDALFNGIAVVELIKSCIPNIKDPWKITSDDVDAILISIRAASGNDTLEMDSTCPSCTEMESYGVNLINVLSQLKPANYDDLLEVSDLKIKLHPLTYRDMNKAAMGQFEISRAFINIQTLEDDEEREGKTREALEKITFLTMELLTHSIEYIETPNVTVTEKEFILDFLRHCDSTIYTTIRDYSAELRKQSEIPPLKVQCGNCEHEYEQTFTINPTDFFG